jgi:hypothetical protein
MILGGFLIVMALAIYYLHKPKRPPKGSVSYYKERWRLISNY